MSYLEELLPEFRKGAKIRRSNWPEGHCVKLDTSKKFIVDNNGKLYTIYAEEFLADNWEFYQESIDWNYIIKNKCLCWFWDEGEEGNKIAGILRKIQKDSPIPFITDTGEYDYTTGYANCRPVRRDEVTFYEDKKDDRNE